MPPWRPAQRRKSKHVQPVGQTEHAGQVELARRAVQVLGQRAQADEGRVVVAHDVGHPLQQGVLAQQAVAALGVARAVGLELQGRQPALDGEAAHIVQQPGHVKVGAFGPGQVQRPCQAHGGKGHALVVAHHLGADEIQRAGEPGEKVEQAYGHHSAPKKLGAVHLNLGLAAHVFLRAFPARLRGALPGSARERTQAGSFPATGAAVWRAAWSGAKWCGPVRAPSHYASRRLSGPAFRPQRFGPEVSLRAGQPESAPACCAYRPCAGRNACPSLRRRKPVHHLWTMKEHMWAM